MEINGFDSSLLLVSLVGQGKGDSEHLYNGGNMGVVTWNFDLFVGHV